LRSLGASQEIVVIGGSALAALGLVSRATKDVDLVAIANGGELTSARPLPDSLREARYPSLGYRMVLNEALSALGVEDAALGA
jgi:hypothetical protein